MLGRCMHPRLPAPVHFAQSPTQHANATVFLGQQTRVPHLAVIFGTIPKLYFYAEYTPRVDLRTDYGDDSNKQE